MADRYSPEWSNYILGMLTEDELVKGKPTTDGLRRIFQREIGTIISSDAHVVDPAGINNERRATVQYTITYIDLLDNITKQITDAADSYYGNTMSPFKYYPTATASTMAEGRCLRKALGIKIVTLEESLEPNPEEAQQLEDMSNDHIVATDNQKQAVRRICDRLNIDINKLIKHLNDVGSKSIDTLSYNDALILMRKLNKYQQGPLSDGEMIPEEVVHTPTPAETTPE